MYGLIRINSNCSESFGINSMYLLFARIRRLHYLKTSSGSWSWSLPSIESNGSLKYALNMLFLATSWTKRHFQEILFINMMFITDSCSTLNLISGNSFLFHAVSILLQIDVCDSHIDITKTLSSTFKFVDKNQQQRPNDIPINSVPWCQDQRAYQFIHQISALIEQVTAWCLVWWIAQQNRGTAKSAHSKA